MDLGHGDVVVMFGWALQEEFKHAVPKDSKCTDIRLNLSFRHHLTQKREQDFKNFKKLCAFSKQNKILLQKKIMKIIDQK